GDGKIYVVEFWATWCPPCRASIPHLSELNKRFKDKGVVFIGVTDEEPTKVKPFVQNMGEKMNYTVAIDDSKQTGAAYAWGIRGIPSAFVIDRKGKAVWYGHPLIGLEQVIDQVLAGKSDWADLKTLSEKI